MSFGLAVTGSETVGTMRFFIAVKAIAEGVTRAERGDATKLLEYTNARTERNETCALGTQPQHCHKVPVPDGVCHVYHRCKARIRPPLLPCGNKHLQSTA